MLEAKTFNLVDFKFRFLSISKSKKLISSSLFTLIQGATRTTFPTLTSLSESHLTIKPAQREWPTKIVFSFISNLSNSFFHSLY
ncbi:TPA: hypothetical protein DEG21_04145 [Patescibacteria group bacterium]|nr:hypothetical protein [Candidatus Gracilibacteria bacterium]